MLLDTSRSSLFLGQFLGVLRDAGSPIKMAHITARCHTNRNSARLTSLGQLARQYFPNEDPFGRKIKFQILDRPFLDAPHDTYFEIIGIVTDFKTRDYEDPSWQSHPRPIFLIVSRDSATAPLWPEPQSIPTLCCRVLVKKFGA